MCVFTRHFRFFYSPRHLSVSATLKHFRHNAFFLPPAFPFFSAQHNKPLINTFSIIYCFPLLLPLFWRFCFSWLVLFKSVHTLPVCLFLLFFVLLFPFSMFSLFRVLPAKGYKHLLPLVQQCMYTYVFAMNQNKGAAAAINVM